MPRNSRRTGVPDARAVAEEDLKHAQAQVDTTAAAVRTAEQQLAASEAIVSRTTVATHPNVKQAAAKLREAYLAAHRAYLVEPIAFSVVLLNVVVTAQRAAAIVGGLAIGATVAGVANAVVVIVAVSRRRHRSRR